MGNPSKGNLVSQTGEVLKTLAIPFGVVELSRPDSAGVYEQRGGGKSTKAIAAKLPMNLVGGLVVMLDCTIYGRLDSNGKVKFNPSAPKGVVLSDAGKDAFKIHLNEAVLAWSGRERAFADAYKRLTTAKADKTDKAADLEWAPTAAQTEAIAETAHEPLSNVA